MFPFTSNGPYDEDQRIPHGVRHDEGEELFRPEAVGQAPHKATHEGGHDEHEIELPHMYQSVHEERHHETDIGAIALADGALHETAPEDLFGRTGDEEQ